MIFLALPSYGSVEHELIKTVSHASKSPFIFSTSSSSLLTDNFNCLWCEFMNGDYTHFAMLHSDISAESLWLDKLKEEMDRVNADVLSVVIPIKDSSGETSTAIKGSDGKVQRIALKHLQDYPETFSDEDSGGTLLVNTGLWIAKKGDWCSKFPGFHTLSDIYFDGTWKKRCVSEDWLFSQWAKQQGLKVYATRKIQATHIGRHGWKNYDN